MTAPITGAQLLRDAGFTYDERTDMWANVKAARAISGETVQRNTEHWIAKWIAAIPKPPAN
jgi:hypothetical protein